MKQLEIEYFFPLTEQIPLDLDYTPCQEYERTKRGSLLSSTVDWVMVNGITGASVPNWSANTLCIDIDQQPITILSKKKPNLFLRYVYRSLGMKWKSK